MEKVIFNVSAKTARLIGRENIADLDGAIVELVKNAYDADADCVFVRFDIPFPNASNKLKKSMVKRFFNDDEYAKLLEFYNEEDNNLIKKEGLSNIEESDLIKMLLTKNSILILDNGTGMNHDILTSAWMNIGTDNKEVAFSSIKGRIKTGAKGIGRFALDKLSTSTTVFTKSAEDTLFKWFLNWNDFDKVKLINQVEATIEENNSDFQEIVRNFLGEDYHIIKGYDWGKGTLIFLTPLREEWNERLFKKVNNNLTSINPLGMVDKFSVHLKNTYFSDLNFHPEKANIQKDDYDYKIDLKYDGNDMLELVLERNEIDLNKDEEISITDEGSKNSYSVNLKEFWNREKFQKPDFRKETYNSLIQKTYELKDIMANSEDIIVLKKLGPISFNAYFLKAGASDTEIVKKIAVTRRKNLLKTHSGIKIYRDNFKVRPYGDDGPMYDWLSLGKRAQTSPAAPSHPSGQWRVEPYQVIGSLSIGRRTNPNLEDMANREGIAANDVFYTMITFLQNIIDMFECDRQYVLREFALWKKQSIAQLAPKKTQIIDNIKNENRNKTQKTNYVQNEKEIKRDSFTKDDYKEVLTEFVNSSEDEIKARQILMMFSSAGIITNTFAHEIERLGTEFGSRMQHLRVSVTKLLKPDEYSGDPDFNPFDQIKTNEDADILLSSWISVIMNGLQSEGLPINTIDIKHVINKILSKWVPLLKLKRIKIDYNFMENINYEFSEADLYLIINNFILNSAWFLESVKDRTISISIEQNDSDIMIVMKNNGEPLNVKYKDNPYRIFNPGETSKNDNIDDRSEFLGKNKGTGLGLWVVKEVVDKYFGQIKVLDLIDGFGLKLIFPRSK